MTEKPRIRVGLVGLSTTSNAANFAARAHLPYLQSPQGQELFEIVALCNSSVESAKKAAEHFKVGSVKAYGSADDLARDPDVDLVVNVTGVGQHHGILMSTLKTGKDVYTELPLASKMEQMRELMQALGEAKVKNVFGMQGQTSIVTKVLKDVIAQGRIGKVLSTTWSGAGVLLGEKPLPVGLKSFLVREVGGNQMTVGFLHSINYILATLGELSTFHSILGNQRPHIHLTDPAHPDNPLEPITKDTPDQILLQGRLASGALISYHYRGGDPFPGQPGAVWSIYGEKGEIRVTAPMCLLDIAHAGVSIRLQVFGKEAEEVPVPQDRLGGLPHPAQNVGRIYEAFAAGEGYPDWELAMRRHELIEEMWRRSDGRRPFGEAVEEA